MHQDRRRHPRFAVLVKASAEIGGVRHDVVCVDAGPGGGYFTGRIAPKSNELVEFTLRPPGSGTPRIDLRGEVVYVPRKGEPRHPGFGVRWLTASSRVGVEPLHRVLQDILRIQPAVPLAANESGEVRFDFAAQHAAPTPGPAVQQSPTPAPGRMSPQPGPRSSAVAFHAADLARRSPVPGHTSTARMRSQPDEVGSGQPRVTPPTGWNRETSRRPDSTAQSPRFASAPPALAEQAQAAPRTATPPPGPTRTDATSRPAVAPLASQRPLRPTGPVGATPPTVAPQPALPPLRPAPTDARALSPLQPVSAQQPGPARWSPAPLAERPDAADLPATMAPKVEAKAEAAWRRVSEQLTVSPTFDSSDQVDSTQRYAPLPEDSRPSSMPVAPGAMSKTPWPEGIPLALAERYSDMRLLGRGGHGVVYRANDQLLDREVVLKFMVSGAMPNEMARRYFLREVKLAAGLSHPNIVNIYDLGISEGVLYYAMEYIDGEPLVELLKKVEVIRDADQLWSLVSQLCDALTYAHDRGILHRDVKPENVLLTPDGKIKLFDFGLARGVADGFGEQSLLIGTPFYMAPEQITSSDKVDQRADIYSLGVLLYRMCTGVLPFTKGNLFVAHAIEPVPDPRLHRADLPPALVTLLFRLLAKLPEQRPATCAVVAQELHRALYGR